MARSNFYRDPISSVLLSEDEIVYSTAPGEFPHNITGYDQNNTFAIPVGEHRVRIDSCLTT
jgi:hypothetical protein